MRALVGIVLLVVAGCAMSVPPTAVPPSEVPASLSPSPAPTASSSPSASGASCASTDQTAYIYHPARLQLVADCIHVTGTVAAVRVEADGDRHILVALDPAFAHYLTPANQGQELGDLVVEPVCVGKVTQADAIAICASDPDPLKVLPLVGQHVWLEGRYVLDTQHGSWAEIHPLAAWGVQ